MTQFAQTLRAAVFLGVLLVGVACSTPSDSVVRREFLDRYPDAMITNVELIFEQNRNVVYLVTARENQTGLEGKYDFAMHYLNGKWAWCDDQTERKCKKTWE